MTFKVGVLSDTHGLLRPEVVSVLTACDYILHAGDLDTPEVYQALRSIAPLYAVRGNNDLEWAEGLPASLSFEIGGVGFFMAHQLKDVPAALGGADIVLCGHSHRYSEERSGGRLWLNPGSCGKRRFRLELTMAALQIDHGAYRLAKLTFP